MTDYENGYAAAIRDARAKCEEIAAADQRTSDLSPDAGQRERFSVYAYRVRQVATAVSSLLPAPPEVAKCGTCDDTGTVEGSPVDPGTGTGREYPCPVCVAQGREPSDYCREPRIAASASLPAPAAVEPRAVPDWENGVEVEIVHKCAMSCHPEVESVTIRLSKGDPR